MFKNDNVLMSNTDMFRVKRHLLTLVLNTSDRFLFTTSVFKVLRSKKGYKLLK